MPDSVLIGIDFDNTIVCYDGLFHRVAIERDLIPSDIPPAKTAVRNYLRSVGQEDKWTELQGIIYGREMSRAVAFDGVAEFFESCSNSGIQLRIISHRTRYPYLGETFDLHQAARDWLRQNEFVKKANISDSMIHFEVTKQDKLARIETEGCTHFIDDLPEFLSEPDFPEGLVKILFDPNQLHSNANFIRAENWRAITDIVLRDLSD